ncbi:hypothetical protein [Pseudodesulfovibrio pelocollis]|uniref:hypothetical protein n=1 Tax=Pseudodesulfovibrio pelocollis TaxID=3051432 RepID=UPI00255A8613|nr:hypothetical protein [Pseudodesulfovibrio sp. SB368]
MTQYPVILESANAGVISPTLDGQNTIEPRQRGLHDALNFLVRVEGPTFYRGGTKLVAEARDHDKAGRIMPFVFSTEQAYVIDMGDEHYRFVKGDGIIVKTVASADAWAADGDYSKDDYAAHNAALYRCIQAHGGTTGKEPGVGVDWAAYWQEREDGSAYEISHVYDEAALPGVRRTQSADVFFTANGENPIQMLSRYAHDRWGVSVFESEDGPYLNQNSNTAYKIAASATTGTGVTLTASGTGNKPFASTDPGRHVRLRHGDVIGWGIITEFISETQVKCDIKRNFSATTATDEWRLGAWSQTTGYPLSIGFINESFAAAGTRTQTQTHWKSAADDIYDFAPTTKTGEVLDSSAYAKTIGGSDQVNPIHSIFWSQYLVLLTGGGAWRLVTGTGTITPTSGDMRLDCGIKAANMDPVRIGPKIVFVQKYGKRIYALQYQFENDGLSEQLLSRLAGKLFMSGVKEIAFQESPEQYLWSLLNDGTLVCMAYDSDEGVVGCFPVAISGGSGGNAEVESIAVIPGDNGRDNLYLRVKRTLKGGIYRTIERLTLGYTPYEDGQGETDLLERQKSAFFVDCGISYEGEPTSVITGLDMFNGETVRILADGAVHPEQVVENGQITLQYEASLVHVGLGYQGYMAPARREFETRYGTSHGRRKRLESANVLVRESLDIRYGPTLADLTRIPLAKSNRTLGQPTPLFTGEIPLKVTGSWQHVCPDLYIAHDSPTPCEIQRIDRFISVEDN